MFIRVSGGWSWGWGSGGWSLSGGWFWVSGLSFESDLRIVTVLPVGCVFHNLGSAIREQDTVFSLYDIPVALGLVGEIVAHIVLHGVGEVKWHSWLVFTIGSKSLSSNLSLRFSFWGCWGEVGIFGGFGFLVVVLGYRCSNAEEQGQGLESMHLE